MIVFFALTTSGQTPTVKFYNGATLVGSAGGYAAAESGTSRSYSCDVGTDLDASIGSYLRLVLTTPDAVGYAVVTATNTYEIDYVEHPTGSGGTGTGARTVTVTVDDGAAPLEGATVRYTKGAETYLGLTDVSGVIVFGLDDGTWGVAVTLPGYIFTPTTLVVDGNETVTYSMTQVVIPPAGVPGMTNAFFYTRNETGIVPDVEIEVKLVSAPSGTGSAFIGRTTRGSSDGAGLFQWSAFVGSTYQLKIGTDIMQVTIPADAADPYEVTNQLVCINC